MDKYDVLQKLQDLRAQGTISEGEFQAEKRKLLSGEGNGRVAISNSGYIMLMHLTQLVGLIFLFLGFIVPLVMWRLKAKENPDIDLHGKNIANFIISMIIYGIISFILCFAGIGFILLYALGLFEIVCVIIATIKASDGKYWQYPLAIRFF